MGNKAALEQNIANMKAELAKMEKQLESSKDYYEIPDNIKINSKSWTGSYGVGIISEDGKRELYYSHSYKTYLAAQSYKANTSDYVLVPVSKSDIKVGDLVLATNLADMESAGFIDRYKIWIGDGVYAHHASYGGVQVDSLTWKHYYRVTKRSEVERCH